MIIIVIRSTEHQELFFFLLFIRFLLRQKRLAKSNNENDKNNNMKTTDITLISSTIHHNQQHTFNTYSLIPEYEHFLLSLYSEYKPLLPLQSRQIYLKVIQLKLYVWKCVVKRYSLIRINEQTNKYIYGNFFSCVLLKTYKNVTIEMK